MLKFELQGIKQFSQRAKSNQLKADLTQPFFEYAAKACLAEQIKIAPNWRGNISNSLSILYPQSVPYKEILVGHAERTPRHAKFMEFGTGTQHINENYTLAPNPIHITGARHIRTWSRSRGLNPYAVAKKMNERGGLKPRKYIRSGWQKLNNAAFWNTASASFNVEVEI